MAGYGVELEDGVSEYTARKCIVKISVEIRVT